MGYDMYLESPDEQTQKELEAYQERKDQINKKLEEYRQKTAKSLNVEPNDPEVGDLLRSIANYKELQDEYFSLDDPTYFRLNIWGMGFMRAWMSKLGMLNEVCAAPPWPEPGDYGVSESEAKGEEYVGEDATIDEWGERHSPAWFEYMEASSRVKTQPPDVGSGIAWYKLGSNDGWLVTVEECSDALAAFKKALPITEGVEDPYADLTPAEDKQSDEERFKNDLILLNDWAKWLEKASRSEGFRVW
jgi:hypothetical protein